MKDEFHTFSPLAGRPMLLRMTSSGIPTRGNASKLRAFSQITAAFLVLACASLVAPATGLADPATASRVIDRLQANETPAQTAAQPVAVAPASESEFLSQAAWAAEAMAAQPGPAINAVPVATTVVGDAETPALVEVLTDVGRRWTYVYVRERTRTLAGGEPKVEKTRGTRFDEISALAPEFGEGVVRVQSKLRAQAAVGRVEAIEERAGFYRAAASSYHLVAEQTTDPTSGIASLVHYEAPLSVIEAGAQPGQRWKVGIRSRGDLHTDLDGEVLGLQDVQTPHGLYERCLVIRLTGQISGVVEAYGSRIEVPSGDFSVTEWYAPGVGRVLVKEKLEQMLVLEDGSTVEYSERTQFALRSFVLPSAAVPAAGE